MAFEGFPNRGDANATPSSGRGSWRPFKGLRGVSAIDNRRPDPDDRWIPLALLLLGLLPTVAVFFVVGSALALR